MIARIKNKLSSDIHLAELVKGSSKGFFLTAIGMAIGYLSVLYMTNYYGASAFGQYTIALTILSIATLLPKFGMENSLVRIIGELYSKGRIDDIFGALKTSFLLGFFLATVTALFVFIFSDKISTWISKPNMDSYIQLVSWAIIPSVLITLMAATLQAMRKIFSFMLLSSVLTPLIYLISLLLSNSIFNINISLLTLYVFSLIMATAFGFIIFKKITPSLNLKKGHQYKLSSLLNISFPMLLSSSFVMIMTWTDVLMLTYYMTEADVGVYAVAQKVAGLTTIFLIAINAIAAPKFVQLYTKKDLKGLETIVKQSTKLIFYTSLPLLIILLFFPKFILGLFGDEFIIGYIVLMILTAGQFINAMSGSVGYIMQMTDNQKIFQNVILFSAFINVVLNYILIPLYGINGAAFSSMFSIVLWNVILMVFIKRKLGFYTIYIPGVVTLSRT